MLDMNPEIREQWCKALRSGEYTQAQNDLRIRKDGTNSYCCLGVLTDLYVKAGNPETFQVDGFRANFNVWEESTLPEPVMQWAGLGSDNPVLAAVDPEGHLIGSAMASEWNDDYDTDFQKIADMIDGGPAKQS